MDKADKPIKIRLPLGLTARLQAVSDLYGTIPYDAAIEMIDKGITLVEETRDYADRIHAKEQEIIASKKMWFNNTDISEGETT